MSSNFITNQEKFLSEIINGILPKTDAIDILVGYFYFSGFETLSDEKKNQKLRILVGLDVEIMISKYIREVEEEGRGSIQDKRNTFYSKFVQLFNDTDYFDCDAKKEQFKLFCDKISDGTLEIRKTKDPCHAKMYLFAYNDMMNEGGELPGVLITGSSNLSYQGMKGRLELNARFNDKADYEEGKRIFEEQWANSILIVNKDNLDDWIKKVMIHIWYGRLFPPYLMYIRVLKEYFSIPTRDNIITPYDITEGRYANLRYQTDAVLMALKSLENHNGAIISDVVGLGKSIIASTVAYNLKLRTIVICPPHLKEQWEDYKIEFKLWATVYSSGKIGEALSHYSQTVGENEQYLIIIDEAHRYRNESTQDYADLHNLCSGNKVLLLTATPFNNKPEDIYSLIKLFQIPTHSTLKTVENLGATFKSLIENYRKLRKDQREGKINESEQEREIASISKSIRTIITPLVIRRSRIDLQEIDEYKEDLKRQGIELTIPNDPEELTYELDGLRDQYLCTLDQISPLDEDSSTHIHGFKAARYSPVRYIREGETENLAKELKEKTGGDFYLLMGRQQELSKFMRRLLVARFESSVAAFRESLGYMIESSEQLLNWVNKRKKIPVYKKGNLPDVANFYDSTNDNMTEEITELFEKYEERGFFEIDMKYINDQFIPDVEADIKLLKGLRKQWFGTENEIKDDPKLRSFIRIIKEKIKKEPKRKIVVFSSYADTVNYLGEQLKEAGLPVMKYTSADASTTNKERIRLNFDAGVKPSLQRDDYKILIATDAISEGFNLHRAGAIFNYDIPYNPTRVIQRIGRINRVNKKMFKKLYIYNYFPTDVGERETRTREISTLKMAMIHAIMGEDTKALTKDEEVQAYFKEQFRKELAKDEAASWDTPYRKLLDSLKGTETYKQALELPHRARTGRKMETRKGVLMFGKKGNDYVFKIGTADSPPIMLSAEDALALFKATEEEEAIKLSKDFDKVYQKVKASLFRSDTKKSREKGIINAIQRVKLWKEESTDERFKGYLDDLMACLNVEALSSLEVSLINGLKKEDAKTLPKKIPAEYLSRQIKAKEKVEMGEEMIILSEEFIINEQS